MNLLKILLLISFVGLTKHPSSSILSGLEQTGLRVTKEECLLLSKLMVLGEVERDGDIDLRRPVVTMETTVAFLVDFGLDLGDSTAIFGGIKCGGTSTTMRSLSCASDIRGAT